MNNQPAPEPPLDGTTEAGLSQVSSLYPEQDLVHLISRERESAAKHIAHQIVTIFGASVLGTLGLGLLGVIILCWLKPAEDVAKYIKDAVVPLITAVATFASTVFGPLLAFVLGYYFGEKRGKV